MVGGFCCIYLSRASIPLLFWLRSLYTLHSLPLSLSRYSPLHTFPYLSLRCCYSLLLFYHTFPIFIYPHLSHIHLQPSIPILLSLCCCCCSPPHILLPVTLLTLWIPTHCCSMGCGGCLEQFPSFVTYIPHVWPYLFVITPHIYIPFPLLCGGWRHLNYITPLHIPHSPMGGGWSREGRVVGVDHCYPPLGQGALFRHSIYFGICCCLPLLCWVFPHSSLLFPSTFSDFTHISFHLFVIINFVGDRLRCCDPSTHTRVHSSGTVHYSHLLLLPVTLFPSTCIALILRYFTILRSTFYNVTLLCSIHCIAVYLIHLLYYICCYLGVGPTPLISHICYTSLSHGTILHLHLFVCCPHIPYTFFIFCYRLLHLCCHLLFCYVGGCVGFDLGGGVHCSFLVWV